MYFGGYEGGDKRVSELCMGIGASSMRICNQPDERISFGCRRKSCMAMASSLFNQDH
jgi:hypothetical protein